MINDRKHYSFQVRPQSRLRDSFGIIEVVLLALIEWLQVSFETAAENLEEPLETPSEPVRASTHSSGGSDVEAELRHQLEQSRAEVDFLRDELVHRRQTDKALGTVIEAFKLNAETTRSQLTTPQPSDQRNRWESGQHDIVPSHREAAEQ